MKRILTILSVLALSALVTFGLGQQEGDYGSGLSGGLGGGFYVKETTFIINWNFDTGMPNVTEVGGVDIVVHPTNSVVTDSVLEIDVSGGGDDYIQQTIPDFNEAWLRINYRLSDADTLGWDDNEQIRCAELGAGNGRSYLVIRLVSGALKFGVTTVGDGGAFTTVLGATEVETDTWYSFLWHIKKATAVGANDGISDLKIDGTLMASQTGWDNDAATYEVLRVGNLADTFDAIYYFDDVKLWSPEGLP